MKDHFLACAEAQMPRIYKKEIVPSIEMQTLGIGDSFVIDLGNHYVGYFSFVMGWVKVYIDAPVRLRVRFAETRRDLEYDYTPYMTRSIGAWLQEDVIHIDFPGEYKMPRRYAARYIRITVECTTRPLTLSNFKFTAQTSADVSATPESTSRDPRLADIERVSLHTLQNCMHRVFEDGPRRDRRLWIGDLRLEALTNYYTFKNLSLVRRCLYLFAAADKNISGFIPAYVYENPVYVSGYWFLQDYSLLFAVTLCDYYEHTGDQKVFYDIYPVAKSQLDAMHAHLGDDGIVTVAPKGDVFIDWCDGLGKITSLHGVYLYALASMADTLKKLGHPDEKLYRERYESAKKAALEKLYNREINAFVCERDGGRPSVHSTVWMILGGVIEGEKAIEALEKARNSPESFKPFTPYMNHYLTEALLKLGQTEEAFSHIRSYWGSMLDLGADTFFEMHVPGDPEYAPECGGREFNSMCHAWSCTPAYFIRKYKK